MVAGDTIEITIQHPTLGSFQFLPKAGESGTLNPGGLMTEDDNKSITSSGIIIKKMTRTAWEYEITCASNGGEAVLAAKKISGDVNDSVIKISMLSGVIFSGRGSIVGDVNENTQDGTFTLKVQGSGSLSKIS